MNGLLTDGASGDLLIEGGGAMVGDTRGQAIEHVMAAMRGEFREWPKLGGEIRRQLHGSGSRIWAARARTMCAAAGVDVSRVEVQDNGKVKVEI